MEIICRRCGGNNWKIKLVYPSMLSLMCNECSSSMITVTSDHNLNVKGSYFKEEEQDTITHYKVSQ